MIRPISIVRYEYFYAASFVLGLAASLATWSQRAAMMTANPVLAKMPWFLPTTTIVGVAISVALWYYTARRPSVVVKWIVVVFAAFAAIGVAISLVTLAIGSAPLTVGALLSLVGNALYMTAASLLFKPDAKLWFGEMPGDEDVVA